MLIKQDLVKVVPDRIARAFNKSGATWLVGVLGKNSLQE